MYIAHVDIAIMVNFQYSLQPLVQCSESQA